MDIVVRRAGIEDVPRMSAVLTASITELCTADHRNDPVILARWLANKSPEGVRAMFADAGGRMLVALDGDRVAAVGSIRGGREIGLNYVHPAHRFKGVSRALLAAMEAELRASGAREAVLTSTATAHRFYLDAGWVDAGPAQDHAGLTCYPMRKVL